MFFSALLMLLIANGTPVLAGHLLGRRLARAVDGGRLAPDGRPWLGVSKTVRGVLLSVAATAASAAVLDLGWSTGVVFGSLAMGGDLLSSFIKRRLGLPPSSRAPGLDQIPEALLPLSGCVAALGLKGWDIPLLVAAFWLLDELLSRLLDRLPGKQRTD